MTILPIAEVKFIAVNGPLTDLDVRRFEQLESLVVAQMMMTDASRFQFPPSIRQLRASNVQWTGLPELPTGIEDFQLQTGVNFVTAGLDLSMFLAMETLYLTNLPLMTELPIMPPNLEYFVAYGNELTGAISGLPTSLENLDVTDNNITELDMSSLTSLQILSAGSNPLTSVPILPNSLLQLTLTNCGLNSTQVNAVLAGLVAAGQSDGTCLISGNAAPTGHGWNDVQTLLSRSWTVDVDGTMPQMDVAALLFDEGTGTEFADSSPNALVNGTLQGDADWLSPGKFGDALQFSGAGWAEVDDSEKLIIDADFTIAFFVKPASTTGTSYLLTFRGGNDSYAVVMGYLADGIVEFYSEQYIGDDPRTAFNTAIADTNWHHVAITYDGTTIKLYLDGVEDRSVAKSFSLAAEGGGILRLASSTGGADFAQCALDCVRLYRRALSAAEIANLQINP